MRRIKESKFTPCCVAFLLTFISYLILFGSKGLYPFGDRSIMMIDSIHQYIPFYSLLQNIIKNGGSFTYSFSGGLGFNFLITIAYYLSCPLNIILALLPQDAIFEFMDYFIIIKLAAAAFFMSYYLYKRNDKYRVLAVVFGFAYGMSGYMSGYFFNIMWLDSIAVFPIIIYGLDSLFYEKKWKTYLFSLAWAIWCNYYIGFIICIFSLLYYLINTVFEKISVKDKLKSICRFIWPSALAVTLSSILIIPTYFGLNNTEQTIGSSAPGFNFFQNIFDVIDKHLIFSESVHVYENQSGLNIYCGILFLLLLLLYFVSKANPIKEKIKKIIIICFLYLGFTNRFVNYIWHGFHVQNGIPNRHAFIYVAILIIIGYDVLTGIKNYTNKEIICTSIGLIIYILIRRFAFNVDLSITQIILNSAFIVLYTIILLFLRRTCSWKPYCIICVLLVAEIITHSFGVFHDTVLPARSFYLRDRESYQKMTSLYTNDNEFYRSEIDRQHMRDAVIFSGGNSVVLFNSTMLGSVTNLFNKLGMESRTNKTGYYGFTRLTNDIFGIKYIASPQKLSDTFYGYPAIAEYGPFALYKNRAALSIGFVVDKDIKNWDIYKGNPFEVQNSFLKHAIGMDEDLFIYMYKIEAEDGVTYTVMDEKDSQTYILLEYNASNIDIETPEYKKLINDYNDFIIPVNGNEDDWSSSFSVTTDFEGGKINTFVYKCSEDLYDSAHNLLSREVLEDVKVSGNKLSGTVTSKDGGELLLTIPYTPEWKLKVDGVNIKADKIGDSLIGLDLNKGTHTIEMKFIPNGLHLGVIISLISLILIIFLLFRDARKFNFFNIIKQEHL